MNSNFQEEVPQEEEDVGEVEREEEIREERERDEEDSRRERERRERERHREEWERNQERERARLRRRARSREANIGLVLDIPLDNIPSNHIFSYGIPCPETNSILPVELKNISLPCVVCQINQIQTVNFPCMHACFCIECAKPALGHSSKCPQCRTELMHVSLLYLPYKDCEPSSKKIKSENSTE